MPIPGADLDLWPAERPQVDAESIVMDMLNESFAPDAQGLGWDGQPAREIPPMVFNEIDIDTDAYAQLTDVVIFHAEPPIPATSNMRGRVWQVDVELLVESTDVDRAFRLASFVRQAVMAWPRMGSSVHGRVIRVQFPPAFAKAASGKQATAKGVKQYSTGSACTLLVSDRL